MTTIESHPPLFYFDFLPVRPLPYPLESLSSYLMRIAEENGLTTMGSIRRVITSVSHKGDADLSLADLRPMSMLLNRSEHQLQSMTLALVTAKFGRLSHPLIVARFLAGAIAKTLRYCPLCLAEKYYYRLTWRFISIDGCPEHQLKLHDKCPSCQSVLPIMGTSLIKGYCPKCGHDLRSAKFTKKITGTGLRKLQEHYDDINILLAPVEFETSPQEMARRRLATGFVTKKYRYQSGNTRQMLASLLNIKKERVDEIEQGHGRFQEYFLCHQCFKIPIKQFIDDIKESLKIAEKRRRTHYDDQGLIESAQKAIEILRSDSSKLTLKAISKAMRVSEKIITFSKSTSEVVRLAIKQDRQAHADELNFLALKAIDHLKATNQKISGEKVCQLLGFSPKTYKLKPNIKLRVSEEAQKVKTKANLELIAQIREAALWLNTHNKRVSIRGITKRIGQPYTRLTYDADIRSEIYRIITSYEPQKSQKLLFQEEDQLIAKAHQIMQRFRNCNQPIRASKVYTELRVSKGRLHDYPRLERLLNAISKEYSTERAISRQKREKELVVEVNSVIRSLEAQKKKVTVTAIYNASQVVSRETLYYYPAVREIIKRVVNSNKHKTELKNKDIFQKAIQAITHLRSQGKVPTFELVSQRLGIKKHTLDRNLRLGPEIRRLIREAKMKDKASARKKR